MENRKQRRQQGFTLIEIIAVIILLGVLAATVIPKFTNLTEDAQRAATQQAVAEGIARVNAYAAQYILHTGSAPDDWAAITGDTDITTDGDAGDYTLAFADGTEDGTIAITATHDETSKTGSGIARLPQ